MHIHILGICGTFMGGIAALARAAGHTVSGCDANVYPPMSTQLAELEIELIDGFDSTQADLPVDEFVIGNAMSRGNALVEAILSSGKRYCSGPEWLAREVLAGRDVIAVAGTHGKTTTASLVAHLLDSGGHNCGFLIGGVPRDFGVSARLGESKYFVVEADEYDTAFFDKRAKFVHYRPRYAILNNLEFDHADIYSSLAEIQRQFHHLVRTVPGNGRLFVNHESSALDEVLAMGVWTPQASFGHVSDVAVGMTHAETVTRLHAKGESVVLDFPMSGVHNLDNAAAAASVALELDLPFATVAAGLSSFTGVARRQQRLVDGPNLTVYDDFAHHPTAIRLTLEGLREQHPGRRILVALEPRSNTMRTGVHADQLASALQSAERCFVYRPPELTFDLAAALLPLGPRLQIVDSYAELQADLLAATKLGDVIVLMSNGGFGSLRSDLPAALSAKDLD